MFILIGLAGLFAAVFGGFMMEGGRVGLLLHVNEIIVIFGAGISTVFIANTKLKIIAIFKMLPKVFSGPKYSSQDYKDMLVFLSIFLKVVKTKGFLAVESHIEAPKDSDLFSRYPGFSIDKHLLEFTQEYLRMISMGVDNPHQMEGLIDREIEALERPMKESAKSLGILADALPALGIVAAVMGVILAMGAISEPPEVLGGLIGAALAGTLLGIFGSYGIFSPISGQLQAIADQDVLMFQCIHRTLLAYLEGFAPSIAVEFGRKLLPTDLRPGFSDLEQAVANDVAARRGG